MAKKSINKEIWNNQFKGLKRPVYSIDTNGLLDGLIVEDYEISDKLSNLNFEYGLNLDNYVDGTPVPSIPETVTFIDGNASAYLKTIAAGFTAVEKNTTGTSDVVRVENWNAAPDVSINGVDAGNIYGGIVVTTDCNCKTINFSTSTNRYENIEAIVEGPRTITVNTVKAKALYGGGAGYGSVLEGDVTLNIVGTNTISNVFGGGQKGAVVNGDVNIDISRRDAKSGRIGTVYGGGEDAVVNGDVYITVHGTNAIGVGTVSGSGKGKKSQVNGTRYLIIDGFSGKFSTTIKDFDHITLTSGTAITLTQSQQKSIQSAKYEFVVDQATLNQPNAMLTWNKNIDVGQFYITVADEFASNADDAFVTTIYSSTYLTQAAFDKAGMKVYDEAGKEITSGYSLEFVADQDNKGNAKKKGGAIVLKFDGTNADVTGEDTKNREFTAADDDINIRGKYVSASVDAKGGNNKITLQKDSVMAGNVTAGDGNDRFTVQSGAIMAGTVALGAGENEIDVLGGGEINGAIKLADGTAEKHVKNTIDVNGSISQIEGGNEFTDNTIWIKNEHAVGYWEYDTLLGVRGGLDIALQGDVLSGEISLGEKRANFVDQDLDLTHSNGSNDTVYVTQASKWDGNINFGKGKDTLILNTPATANGPASHGTITAEDGDDVIVANQTGVTIDADKLKLSGTDNILVVSNGVKATIKGMAIGDFTPEYGQFNGLFLGQNAILSDSGDEKGENKKYAVESFNGNMTLQGELTVLTAKDYTNPESENYSQELADRIGTFYTVGNGVNGNIDAAGNKITLSKDTTVTGNISGLNGKTITLLEGAKINGTVVGNANIYFKQNAGSEDLSFELEKDEKATIEVAKNAIATVGSISGITGTTFRGEANFDQEASLVTLNENAALYAAKGGEDAKGDLLVGKITTATDFNDEKYAGMTGGRISIIDDVKARITLVKDATVYVARRWSKDKDGKDVIKDVVIDGGMHFEGTDNKVLVNSGTLVLDRKQLFIKEGDKVDFNILDGAELVFDGLAKGEDLLKDEKVSFTLDKNARLAYGENLVTGSWSEEFNAGKLDDGKRTNITFREGSLVDNKIMLKDADKDLVVNIEKDSVVKGDLTIEDKGVILLGKGEDTLNVAVATVDGVINTREADFGAADKKDVINLAGSTVNGMAAPHEEIAIAMDDEDMANLTAGATVNGDIVGGKELVIKEKSKVTGSISAKKSILDDATVHAVVGGDAFVEKNDSQIDMVGSTEADVAVYADGVTANIGTDDPEAAVIVGKKGSGKTVAFNARNGGTIALKGVDAEVSTVKFGAIHKDSAVDFGGDVNLVADNAEFGIQDGGAFKNLGNIEVSGGAAADLKPLKGEREAAASAKIWSINGADIEAKDVTFVAKDSEISIDSEGKANTFGNIVQTGKVTKDGYKRLPGAEQADKATVSVTKAAAFNAGSIDQLAKEATVAVGFDKNGVVEGSAITTKIAGDITQEGDDAIAAFSGDTTVAGGIAQKATGNAIVLGDGKMTVAADIVQSGNVANVAFGGTATVTGTISQAAKTAAAVQIQGDAKVGAIAQTADVAWTVVDGTADVAGGIVQKNVNDKGEDIAAKEAVVKIAGAVKGDVTQLAEDALVEFDKESEIGSVGNVMQSGSNTAKVIATANVEQKYPKPDDFNVALEDKSIDTLERTVGAVDQTSDVNTVEFGATVEANGLYDLANHHKAAKVDVGSVTLKADAITQTGATNTVKAVAEYKAEGEADVKIGATTLDLGTVTQYSDEGTLNTVEIKAKATTGAENESIMTVGDITATAGAINQTAYKASNKVEIDMVSEDANNLTVGEVKMDVAGGINMRAYGDGANNDLTIKGKVNVNGDIQVGGVIDAEHISEDSAWGDRTANKNTVEVTADEAAINGDLSLVGMENELTLKNDSYFTKGDTEAKSVAKSVTLAGKKNKIDIAAGLKIDNIGLYDLTDWDGNGVEGYDLTYGQKYTNDITLRGEVSAFVLNKQLKSDDTINVFGGKIEGDVVTGNGQDKINLSNDGLKIKVGDDESARVMGDSTIGGSVTMGVKGEAEGSNKITALAFAAKDLVNTDEAVAHGVSIGGAVEMYAGKEGKAGDPDYVEASNELALAGLLNGQKDGTLTTGSATIGGSVTMVAENEYDGAGKVLDKGQNKLLMAELAKIDGDVTMTAYKSNAIDFKSYEEWKLDTSINGYSEITGKVVMQAKDNTINVGGTIDGKDYAGAAYMNGLSMTQKYTDLDGKEYLIKGGKNSVTVGNKTANAGSELIVGKSISETADVTMGTVAFEKPLDSKVVWDLESISKAAKGHDIIEYLGKKDAVVTGLTAENAIDVTGRFDSAAIVMMASKNAISVQGDGKLAKATDEKIATDDVRTATFTAADIVQVAGLADDAKNEISAIGTGDVDHFGYAIDAATGEKAANITKIASLPSVRFNSGNISQVQYATMKDGDTSKLNNTVSLTDSIIASTGDITQLGNGENKVTVEAFEATTVGTAETLADMGLAVERSAVGAIAQGAADTLAATNDVNLKRTDAGTITQFVEGVAATEWDNNVKLDQSTSGDITQTAVGNDTITDSSNKVKLTDSISGAITQTAVGNNLADIDPSTSGAITQTSAEGWNGISGKGELTPNVGDDGKLTSDKPLVEKSYIKGEINQTTTGKSNEVDAYLTDIEGGITQDGVTLNKVSVRGKEADVKFAHVDETKPLGTYKEQVTVSVGGDIVQKNAGVNVTDLAEVEFGKNVDQTAKSMNIFSAKATATNAATNEGVSPDEEFCEFHKTDPNKKPHASSTVEVGAKFNTLSVGTVTQTVALTAEDIPEGGALLVPPYGNAVAADNVNVDAITQKHNFSSNKIDINQTFTGKVTDKATYPGEIDNALNDVTYVADIEKNTTTQVGAISQTGTSNAINARGITGSTVTQSAVAPEVVDGVAGGNTLVVDKVEDVKAQVVSKAKWEPDVAGFDKEVFTNAILDGSDNVRAGNTLKTIEQKTAATGNFEVAKQVENKIDLKNTTVDGDVTQKAEKANANVKNTFAAETTKQAFAALATVEAGTTKVGDKVEFNRLSDLKGESVMDDITGKLTQTGYDNAATVTNVNVKGDVKQTANMIDTTDHHGDQFAGTDVGDNALAINGSKDGAVAAMGLDEKFNIVDVAVGGKITQLVDNKDGKTVDAGGTSYISALTSSNTITAKLANMGEITQTTTYGKNSIDIDSEAITGKPKAQLKAGAITQNGGQRNFVDAQTTAVDGEIKQVAVAKEGAEKYSDGYFRNTINLTGDVVTNRADLIETPESGYDQEHPETIKLAAADSWTAASATSIYQEANRLVDADGYANIDNAPNASENNVKLDKATVGSVTQKGVNRTDNTLTFEGLNLQTYVVDPETGKADIDPTLDEKVNTIGQVDQTGTRNKADITMAKSAGNLTQIAASGKYKETAADESVKATMFKKATNEANLTDVAAAGEVIQTATSVKYDEIVTDKDGKVVDAKSSYGLPVEADNKATFTRVNDKAEDAKNVIQTIDGSAGVGKNTLTVDKSNLGNIDQNAVDGNNAIYLTNADDAVKTVGTINQDGLKNIVKTGAETGDAIAANITTGAIVQNANGIAGMTAAAGTAELTNTVNLKGNVTPADAVATLKDGAEEGSKDPESYEFKDASYYATAADSIKQVVNGVADENDRFAKDMDATNAVTLTAASAGFVWQEGNVGTANTINFEGAVVQHKEFDLDEKGEVKLDASKNATLKNAQLEYPNVIGAVTQKGVTNFASIEKGSVATKGEDDKLTAANIEQTADTYKWIDLSNVNADGEEIAKKDPTKPLYVTGAYESPIYNRLDLSTVATAGTITQTVNGEEFTIDEYDEMGAAPVKQTKASANGSNLAYLTDANTGNITQKITGKDGYKTAGDNYITATRTNIGIVDQDALNGKNYLYLSNDAVADDQHKKVDGKVDQDGIQNTIETATYNPDGAGTKTHKAANVEITGKITQNATGITATDTLSNSVNLEGIVIDPADTYTLPDGADPSLPESYVFDPNGHVTATKADAIEQTVTAKEVKVEGEVKYFGGQPTSNTVTLKYADAGAVTQTGSANTTNRVDFDGAVVTVKAIEETKPTTVEDFDEHGNKTGEHEAWAPVTPAAERTVYPNVIGEITQEQGVTNDADIKDGSVATKGEDDKLTAADITQIAVSNKTITETPVQIDTTATPGTETEEFKVVKTGMVETISNTVTLDNVATVGAISQTAAKKAEDGKLSAEKFNETTEVLRHHGDNEDGTPNWVTTGPHTDKAGNPVNYLENPAITALTGGVALKDNPTTGPDKYVDGANKVEIKARTNVAGKITQEAAGDYDTIPTGATYANHVEATEGEIRQTLPKDPADGKTVSKDNPQTIVPGAYLNTIGDVEQTLASYADTFAIYGNATNFIELGQMNAGALKQTATGYAHNQITSYPGTVVLMEIGEDGMAKKVVDKDGNDVHDKVTIKSIEQTGYYNGINLTDVKIGAVQEDKFVAGNIIVTETAVAGTKPETVSLIDTSLNNITLTNVVVNDISATTAINPVVIDENAGVNLDVYAQTTVTLENTTVNNITLGHGNDSITLKGETTVTGTIDMGLNTATVTEMDPGKRWEVAADGVDTLTLTSGFDGDLSDATIRNVETFTIKNDVTLNYPVGGGADQYRLYVKSIQAESIEFEVNGDIFAEYVELGTVKGISTININNVSREGAGDKSLVVKFNNDISSNGVMGATTKDVALDTVYLGDGVLAQGDTADQIAVNFFDIDVVNFADKADASGSNWVRTSGDTNKKITFNFTKETIGESEKFAIGTLLDDQFGFEGYDQADITFKHGDEAFTYKTGSGNTWESDDHRFTYDGKTLTYTTIV